MAPPDPWPDEPRIFEPSPVEVLAPAGSYESLVAAVENGAGAVYLAGQHFGARKFAQNFTRDELRRAIDHAHVRGVKVFVTVNTLVKNDEFDGLVPFLRDVHDAGADAVIVQDLGVMRLVRDLFPDLPVHISTQATVHNSKGVLWLETLGAERVILAREMDTREIAGVKENTGAELESFVHGALCYSYSGQCLASSLIGGRSGNRGACAYTCRLPFDVSGGGALPTSGPDPDRTEPERVLARHKHVLSSKDLETIDMIPDMVEAGVTSLKIEGRMKRPEYVAIATEVYRKAVDRTLAGNFHITDDERARLLRVFNRDFTQGFHPDGAGKWAFTNWDSSGNRGTVLGRVERSGDRTVRIRLDEDLRVGDGIEIVHEPDAWQDEAATSQLHKDRPSADARADERFRKKRDAGKLESFGPEEWGWTVRQMWVVKDNEPQEVGYAHAGELVEMRGHQHARPGDPVYKTADFEVLDTARKTYEGGPHRKVPVIVEAFVEVGEPLRVRLLDRHRLEAVEHVSDYEVQPARKAPLTEANVAEQVEKLGDTPFHAVHVNVHLGDGAFVPISVLNDARREAADALERALAARHHRASPDDLAERAAAYTGLVRREREPRTPTLTVKCWGLPNVEAALRGGATQIAFGGLKVGGLRPKWDEEGLARALDLAAESDARVWIDSGTVQHDWEVEMLAAAVERFAGHPAFAGVLTGHHGGMKVAQDAGVPFVADHSLNLFNSVTLEFLAGQGAERVVLSPELTLDEIREIGAHTATPIEVMVHGRLALMTSEYCSIGHITDCQKKTRAPCHERPYQITDQKGYRFPLVTDGACRMYMMNSVELNMIDRIPELAAAGIDAIRIETMGTTPEATEVQVRTYLEALRAYEAAGGEWAFERRWWDELAAVCPDGFTTGHFDRGPL